MLGQTAIRGATAGQIAASVEEAIRESILNPGAKLPPIRALADELGVSPMTVASAYGELRRRGFLLAAGRRGTRVSDRPPVQLRTRIMVPAGARDLATGNPDPDLLPPLGEALRRIDTSTDGYLDEGKLPSLVELAAERLGADGIGAPDIAIVGGALDGIERVLQAHLRPGDLVAVEDPGFVRAYDLLRPLGLRLQPVRLDDAGPRVDDLERALARGARGIILTPRAQNPTGAALDPARANDLRSMLREREDVLIVEDDHAADVAGAPAYTVSEPDRPNWALVRSVSKSLGPDLRLAILAGDPVTIARVEGRQLLGTGWVSRILQQIVVAFWSDPAIRRKLKQAEEIYRARRELLLSSLKRARIDAHGRSGFNVILPVAEEAGLTAALLQRGWAVTAMERWRITSPPAIRITTTTLKPEETRQLTDDLTEILAATPTAYSA